MSAVANKDIRQKIVLEGEKEYKNALRDAQRELKTLRSELKLETAELGKNATEQEKTAVKVKNLEKQIKEQEKIVKTYTEALAEVREKYAGNQDEIAKWEIKLNDARTTLANMRNSLDDVGKSFQQVGADANTGVTAAKSFADSFQSIAGIGDTVSGAIEGIFSGTMEAVRSLAAEVWDLIAETAARADAWGDLATFYGSDAEKVQAWDRAITGAGADFQQFLAFANQLEFRGKDKGLVSWLGLSDVNYEDKFEFAIAAMTELAKKREELGAGKFNEQLGELFSGKSVGIVELIGEWDRVLALRDEYEQKGYLMDAGELDTMNEVDNKLKDIQAKWSMLKDEFATGFGTVTLDIMTNVSGALDALAKYFNAETDDERKEALAELEKNITEAFTKIAKAIENGVKLLNDVAGKLKESEDPIVKTVGNILGGLVEVLEWLTEDNANNAKKALEIIADFWIAGKGVAMIAKIAELAASIKTISLFKALSGGSAAAAAASAAEAGAASGGSWATAFWAAAIKAVPILAAFGVFMKNAITPQGNDDLWDENGNPTELGQELGITGTREEADREWAESEAGLGSHWSDVDRLEAGGMVTKDQYRALNRLWGNYTGQLITNKTQEELLEEARQEFEGQEEMLNDYLRRIYELRNSGERPENLPMEWFGVYGSAAEQITEDVDLDERRYTDAERESAIQDWWDAWRNASNEEDSWDEEASAFEWMKEVLGDDFGEIYDRIIHQLDEIEDQNNLEDLPADWWKRGADENGVTSADIQTLNGLPKATKEAVQELVGSIVLRLDGERVADLLTDRVSQRIAAKID